MLVYTLLAGFVFWRITWLPLLKWSGTDWNNYLVMGSRGSPRTSPIINRSV